MVLARVIQAIPVVASYQRGGASIFSLWLVSQGPPRYFVGCPARSTTSPTASPSHPPRAHPCIGPCGRCAYSRSGPISQVAHSPPSDREHNGMHNQGQGCGVWPSRLALPTSTRHEANPKACILRVTHIVSTVRLHSHSGAPRECQRCGTATVEHRGRAAIHRPTPTVVGLASRHNGGEAIWEGWHRHTATVGHCGRAGI